MFRGGSDIPVYVQKDVLDSTQPNETGTDELDEVFHWEEWVDDQIATLWKVLKILAFLLVVSVLVNGAVILKIASDLYGR